MYNITQLQQANTLFKLWEYANDSTSGLVAGLFLLGFFFIMLLQLKKWPFAESFLTSTVIAFVVGLLLSYAKLLSIVYPLMFLALAAITFFVMILTGK